MVRRVGFIPKIRASNHQPLAKIDPYVVRQSLYRLEEVSQLNFRLRYFNNRRFPKFRSQQLNQDLI